METQIERAGKQTIDDTNVRILTFKSLDYCYGIYINTLCNDLNNDSEEIRLSLLSYLRDFKVNINNDLIKYLKGDVDKKYETSIFMRVEVNRLSNKIYKENNKRDSFFGDVKIKCIIESFRHLLELKEYKNER